MNDKLDQATDTMGHIFNPGDFFNMLKKRWLVIIAVALSVSFIGIYRVMQQPYIYRASAKLSFYIPESVVGNYISGDAMMERPSYYLTQVEIIKSEPVARRIVESLSLVKDTDDQQQMEATISMVKSIIQVDPPKGTDIMGISVSDLNPERAMKLANAAAEAYLRYLDDKRYLAYKKSIGFITDEIGDLEKKQEETHKKLLDFIKKEKITSYGDNMQTSNFDISKGEERNTRDFVESLDSQKVQMEIELAKLLEKYYEEHPKVQKLRNDLRILSEKIQTENSRAQSIKEKRDGEIIVAKQKELEFIKLRDAYKINQEMLESLRRRLSSADVSIDFKRDYIDIIEYAKLPKSPSAPNKKKDALFSILIGLLMGIATGVVLQYFDFTYEKVEDLERELKFPVLSSIPMVKNAVKKGAIILTDLGDDSNLKEAFRLLRTNLKFAVADSPSKLIMVTSSQKGEGKSTVTTNLGIIMAEAGARTLLVDCDLRVHAMKKLFNIDAETGLTDYLNGSMELGNLVVKTGIENLSVLPSGALVDNPSVIFESERMKRFLNEVAVTYDVVLLDSPPIGYVIDASLLTMLVDGAIMVVEAGGVNRKAVVRAFEQLSKGKARIYGMVFNKENLSKTSYYYKYYNYYSSEKRKDSTI